MFATGMKVYVCVHERESDQSVLELQIGKCLPVGIRGKRTLHFEWPEMCVAQIRGIATEYTVVEARLKGPRTPLTEEEEACAAALVSLLMSKFPLLQDLHIILSRRTFKGASGTLAQIVNNVKCRLTLELSDSASVLDFGDIRCYALSIDYIESLFSAPDELLRNLHTLCVIGMRVTTEVINRVFRRLTSLKELKVCRDIVNRSKSWTVMLPQLEYLALNGCETLGLDQSSTCLKGIELTQRCSLDVTLPRTLEEIRLKFSDISPKHDPAAFFDTFPLLRSVHCSGWEIEEEYNRELSWALQKRRDRFVRCVLELARGSKCNHSPLSRLPLEIVCMILFYAANVLGLGKSSSEELSLAFAVRDEYAQIRGFLREGKGFRYYQPTVSNNPWSHRLPFLENGEKMWKVLCPNERRPVFVLESRCEAIEN